MSEYSAEILTAALCQHGGPFYCRRWVCVPNVSWGWGLKYEADLIAVSKSGFCDEVEIKVSRSDLLADRQKAKFRDGLDRRVRRFWYAVPPDLVPAAMDGWAAERGFGVIEVRRIEPRYSGHFPYSCHRHLAAKPRPTEAVQAAEITTLHRLAMLRYWDLRTNYSIWGRINGQG